VLALRGRWILQNPVFTAKGQAELHRNRMLKKFFNNVIWKIKLKK